MSSRPGLPAPSDTQPTSSAGTSELRAQLPAIEPERQVTDWGRSERVEGLMDRTLYDWLYHYWFRCEVEGIEHVPSVGGALLVSTTRARCRPTRR